MNCEIFAEWFMKDFVPAVQHLQHSQNIRSLKALLLMDHFSSHPEELKRSDGSITCMFLPPDTTSLIQPTDFGVLQALKNRYKKETSSKSYHKSRHGNNAKSEGNHQENNCEKFNLHVHAC